MKKSMRLFRLIWPHHLMQEISSRNQVASAKSVGDVKVVVKVVASEFCILQDYSPVKSGCC